MVFDITLHQMIVFFLMLAIGFVLARLGVVRHDFMGGFSALITSLLLPAQLFYSMYSSTTRQTLLDNLLMIVLAAGFYALITFVTFLLAKALRLKGDRGRAFRLCFIFGNTGFVGMPLLSAVFPEHGLLYMSLFTLVDQMLFWTMGVYLSTAKDGIDDARHPGPGHDAGAHHFSLRSLASPNTVVMLITFVLILLAVPLPGLVTDVTGSLANATPAMCMVYLGAMLYYSDFVRALKSIDLYAGAFVKMVLVPVSVGKLLLMWGILPAELLECFVIIMALPVMTAVPIVAHKNGHEGDYTAGITVATLLFSVVTIPLVVWLTF